MVGRTYKGHLYSVQKISNDLFVLIDLGGIYHNKLIPLTSNTEKEIQRTIDRFLEDNARNAQKKPSEYSTLHR